MSISVRRAGLADASAFARIMGDPAVFPGLMQMPYTNEDLWRERQYAETYSVARFHPKPAGIVVA